MRAFLLLLLFGLPFAAAQNSSDTCPILNCCDGDCCGSGTSYSGFSCIPDTNSSGWDGEPAAEAGCATRQCCEQDCCAPGTVYDASTFFCVPEEECNCDVSCSDDDATWKAVEQRVCNGVKCGCDVDLTTDFQESTCDPVTKTRAPAPTSLSNCVLLEIARTGAINIGNLDNVKIKRVVASGVDSEDNGFDVDFEGIIKESLICDTQSVDGDVEFGGSHCPATVTGSTFEKVTTGKDFKFEEGTTVTGNDFGIVTIAKQLELTDEPKEAAPGEPAPVAFNGASNVKDNTFASLTAKECKDKKDNLSTAFEGNIIIQAAGDRKKDCDEEPFISGFPGLLN